MNIRAGLLINENKCNQCLFSNNKIVSDERKADILETCKKKSDYFICHKTNKVVCAGFYEEMKDWSPSIQIAERLELVKFV